MSIKKVLIGAAAGALLFGALATGVFATSGNFDHFWPSTHDKSNHHNGANFNANSQLDKSMCGNKLGSPIINVSEKVQNDSDSGFGLPTYWAFDYFTRHIQVWPTGTWNVAGTYTFTAQYAGQNWNYTVVLSQSGNTVTGTLTDPYLPAQNTLTIVNGSLSGNKITFSVDYPSGSIQGTRTFTGTIDSSGKMSGTWTETGPEQGSNTWSTTAGAATVSNSYCAIVTYDGNFYTVPGQGEPGDASQTFVINAPVDQPINGDMYGGRRATITGTLKSHPEWPMNGIVGADNYKCDLSGNCPGYDSIFGGGSWADKYFDNATNVDQWWGWQYKTDNHGTWVNECSPADVIPSGNSACLGSSGNIQ